MRAAAGAGAGPGRRRAAAKHIPLACRLARPTGSRRARVGLESLPLHLHSGDLERLQKAPPELVFPSTCCRVRASVSRALGGLRRVQLWGEDEGRFWVRSSLLSLYLGSKTRGIFSSRILSFNSGDNQEMARACAALGASGASRTNNSYGSVV